MHNIQLKVTFTILLMIDECRFALPSIAEGSLVHLARVAITPAGWLGVECIRLCN